MPAKYDRCVAKVKRDIASGKLKKGSNAHAVCSHIIKGYSKKEKVEYEKRKTSPIADHIRSKRNG